MVRKKQKKAEKELANLETIHNSFMNNLESLKTFVDSVAPIAQKHDLAARRKIERTFSQILKILGIPKSQIGKKVPRQVKGTITREQAKQIAELSAKLPRLSLPQAQILYRSSFVMLISYFDFLISDLIRYFYRKYPESLSDKALGITLKELSLLGGIDEAIDFVISKEADNVLYDSLVKQKNFFKTTLKIDTKDHIINWNSLIEATERRHIIVHNNCRVNRRYLATVNLSEIPEKAKDIKEGTLIHITEEYFRDVFDEICISGLILIQCCNRKWEKDETGRADEQLALDIYDALEKENWRCAERLGLFSKECEVIDQAYRLVLDVNYCQSLKWQGKDKPMEEELKKFDISALSPKFRLALCALRSDHDGFYKNVENAIIADKLTESDFNKWPLFRELRRDNTYQEKISAIFSSLKKDSNSGG